MKKLVFIVGDLPAQSDQNEFLRHMADTCPDIEWRWVKAVTPAYNLPVKPFNRLLAQLRDPPQSIQVDVVKLALLNGREAHILFRTHPQPILAPDHLVTCEDLIRWLSSDDAAITKEPPWEESVRIAAMLAILAKLIKNKSWNNSDHGHAWTQEADLLGQSPVNRDDGRLYPEACALLGRLQSNVLLTKGGKQGKTKKEWSIRLEQLPAIKQAITTRSLQALREVDVWIPVFEYLDSGPAEMVAVDDYIVNETVRYRCRPQR